jgi:1-acyl-sn-glycerol-3-phosphate acyltransferase
MLWPIYSFFAWVLFAITTLIMLVHTRIAFLLRPDLPRELVFYRVAGTWGMLWARLVGIRIHRHPNNRKYLKRGQSTVLVANHICFLDLHSISYGIRVPFRALSKVENRKIPVFGFFIDPAIVTVDRKSAKDRLASMDRMKGLVERGVSVLVFPEGTRNTRHEKPLGPKFYSGAFRIAIQQQIPVAPVIISGGRSCMPKGGFQLRPGRIDVEVMEPIPTEGLSIDEVDELKKKLYAIMEEGVRSRDPYFADK